MAEERDEERTEPATPRRREEARERGQVVRSADLSSAVVLLAAVLALRFLGKSMIGGLFASVTTVLGGLAAADGEPENLLLHFGGALGAVALGFLPFVGIIVAAALAVNLGQVGFLFTTRPLMPDLDRIDPVSGLGRIFSLRGLVRLAGGLLKLAAVALVVGWTLWVERVRLVELSGRGFELVGGVAADLMLSLSLRAALALLVLAVFEYAFQKWEFERNLRMSKREIREELKRFEGDPRIRERRRAVQQQLALQRMLLGVPGATVVITNPTHLAVAVRYEQSMDAPVVVAKGAETLALRIRESALENDVPIVERKDLARALYRSVDVGQVVPADLYRGVAEILAFVYRLKGLPTAA
ncbi:MAG TPA: flagellar biosynthesis protein FlhB [Solirubrobacteraceae bacterium]|nr:flagellar biosynthesis protein FlhB [Solirubrobacteraceae bacterium]